MKTLIDYQKEIGTPLFTCPSYGISNVNGEEVILPGPASAHNWRQKCEEIVTRIKANS